MAEITAQVDWQRDGAAFTDNRYARSHKWRFDGGLELSASSSPHVVPMPMSDPAAIDPEEAYVASLSSCHMLWFLSIAAKQGFVVDRYHDAAVGELNKNADGKLVVTTVTLRPAVRWATHPRPTPTQIVEMHDNAHRECFIANSVKTNIRIEPLGE